MASRRVLILALMLFAGLFLAHTAQAQLAVSGLSIQSGVNGAEEVHLATSGQLTPQKLFVLGNPDRAVIDLPVVNAGGIGLPADYPGGLVRSVRFGRFSRDTSRLAIDLTAPATVTTKSADASELVLVLTPTGQVPTASAQPSSSPFTAMSQQTAADESAPPSPVIPESKKPLVVIDAGHGGQDPGALGLEDTHEKDITLAFASALKEGLLRTGRYRVGMTREDDRFIMLGERVAIARRMKGDIFISLHADIDPRAHSHGLSIYTLSETASDTEAAALAERENKADILPGLNLNTTDADVASILIDLAQRQTMNKSAKFADMVVADLHPKVEHLVPNTHRFAGFRVLKAPDIPSVLIELGFLSNARDEHLLHSHEYQTLVVASIIKALDEYCAQQKL